MIKATSRDGTTIAFDRYGDGPAVVVVGGQLCDRVLTRPTNARSRIWRPLLPRPGERHRCTPIPQEPA
jgi:hypothetical protein